MPNLFRVEPPMNPSPSQDNVIANTQLLKNTVGFTCKNLFGVSPYNGLAIFGDSQGAYINSQTNGVSYLAHVEKNKDYTVSKNSGVGDSFIIAGFATQPTIPNTTPEANSEVIIDDSSLNSYTFNSDDYEYIAFTVNKTTSGTLTDIQAMICDADLLDKSYEAPSVFGTVKDFITGISGTIKAVVSSIFYPVGTIYETLDSSFNPNTAWGGTWSKLENVFLYGSGEYSVGNTGGEKTHQLTTNEMPSHTHGYNDTTVIETLDLPYWRNGEGWGLTTDVNSTTTQSAGSGQAHNNMPPYIVVNIWRRTA